MDCCQQSASISISAAIDFLAGIAKKTNKKEAMMIAVDVKISCHFYSAYSKSQLFFCHYYDNQPYLLAICVYLEKIHHSFEANNPLYNIIPSILRQKMSLAPISPILQFLQLSSLFSSTGCYIMFPYNLIDSFYALI